MATVLLAWELGGNLGHVARLSAIAAGLTEAGHRVVLAVRDLDAAIAFGLDAAGALVQAPLLAVAAQPAPALPLNHAGLLRNVGFDDAAGLATGVSAWRRLVQDVRPATLVADHAPTAVLAANTLGLPSLGVGSGFFVPPAVAPWPAYQVIAGAPPPAADVLAAGEAAVLMQIDIALAALQLPPQSSLQAAFATSAERLLTYSEFDHYAPVPRRPGSFLGVPEVARGTAPRWPAGTGPKLLAALCPSPYLEATLRALHAAPARVLLRVEGVAADRLAGFRRPGLAVVEGMLHMQAAAAECDFWVNYAGHGFVCEALLAGRPGLLLPDSLERALFARRVLALGAARMVDPEVPGALDAALAQLAAGDAEASAAAQAFAQRHAPSPRSAIPAQVAAAVEALL